MLEAHYSKEKGTWSLAGDTFTHIVGGMAFADPVSPGTARHTVCVAGRNESGVVSVFEGFSGYLDEVVRTAIGLKDRFKLQRIYHSNQAPLLVQEMRKVDGLSRYRQERIPHSTLTKYVNPPETWEHFVGYGVKAHLVPVPALWDSEFQSVVQEWEQAVASKRITLPKQWKDLQRLLSRPLKDSIRGSILRAVVFACLPCLRFTPATQDVRPGGSGRYQNPKGRRVWNVQM